MLKLVVCSVSRVVDEYRARLQKEAEAEVAKALSDRALRKALDSLTVASPVNPKKPPPDIVKLFDAAADKALSPLRRANPSATFSTRLAYEFRKKEWECTSRVSVMVQTDQKGGSRHVVRRGDTLWAIAERTYGDGRYAAEVARANKRAVPKPDLLLVGVTLDLPRLPVVRKGDPPELRSLVTAPKQFQLLPRSVAFPSISIEFGGGAPKTVMIPAQGVVFKVTFRAVGTLTYDRSGSIPIGFNLSKDKAEIEAMVGNVGASFSIDKASVKSVTFSSKLGSWTVGLTPQPRKMALTGSLKATVPPTKAGDGKLSGSLAFEVTVQVLPRVKLQHINGNLFDAALDLAEDSIHVLKGVGIMVAVGVLVVAVVNPIPGDELVAFGLAARFAPSALAMIAR